MNSPNFLRTTAKTAVILSLQELLYTRQLSCNLHNACNAEIKSKWSTGIWQPEGGWIGLGVILITLIFKSLLLRSESLTHYVDAQTSVYIRIDVDKKKSVCCVYVCVCVCVCVCVRACVRVRNALKRKTIDHARMSICC